MGYPCSPAARSSRCGSLQLGIAVLVTLLASCLVAAETSTSLAPSADLNALVLGAVDRMPKGLGYQASQDAITSLGRSISFDGRALHVDPRTAAPAFCSGATYLVFLSVVEQLRQSGRIELPPDAGAALLVQNQPDGTGVWGRWNANGPGTARLFHETGWGSNFTEWDRARPGDFLKIFWTDEIGSRERGHSVVYLGQAVDADGTATLTYWSSNKPEGFAKATIPRTRVRRAIFSRLEHPERISEAARLPATDVYLADMLRRPGTEDEMLSMTGVLKSR
jgi:hypothetical protein